MNKVPSNLTAIDQLNAAAALADKAAPYFAGTRATFPVVWTEQVPIMGVDEHWRLYVNPKRLRTFSVPETAYILIHEVGHCLREHSTRRAAGNYEPKPWNICADAELNGDDWPGLERPTVGLTATKHGWPEHLLAEDYHALLEQQPPPPPDGGSGSGTGALGTDVGGSAADGEPRPWELPGDDDGEPGVTALEQQARRITAAEAIKEHRAQGRGSVPGGWDRWAESIIQPVVPCANELRHVLCTGLQRLGLGVQSYSRIRQVGNLVMPRHKKRQPIVAIVCDTSGSMGEGSNSPMQRALAVVIGLAKHVGGVAVIWTDSETHIQRHVHSLKDVRAKGGGGTDMRVGIRYAAALANGDRPDVIITVTDGDTPWEMEQPKMPHIAVIVESHHGGPSFGKTVKWT